MGNLSLSDILPILYNLGLRTLYEESYQINTTNQKTIPSLISGNPPQNRRISLSEYIRTIEHPYKT